MNQPHPADAPPATGSENGLGNRLSWRQPTFWVLAAYALTAWLLLLILPSAPATGTRDAAWQAVLHHAAASRWQAGVDVVFTYGPLGYLQCSKQFLAGTSVACIVYQLLYKAFYVGLLVHLARRLPRDAAMAFLLANTLLPLLDEDSIYLLTIGYSGLILHADTRANRPWSLPALVFLATSALMKETFLVYGILALVCAGAALGAARRKKEAWLILVGFGLCFVVADGWLAGQSLRNLPDFLRNGWEIVSGYPAAMEARPPNTEFLLGSLLVLGLVGWRLVSAAFASMRTDFPTRAAAARHGTVFLMVGAGLFLAWKAGFTRADPLHNMTFFSYAVATAAAIPVFFPLSARVSYAVPLVVAWVLCQYPLWILNERTSTADRVNANLHWLWSPGRERARLNGLAQQEAAGHALPRCRAVVGDATIDLFGCTQQFLLDTDYHYRPAPIFQPYSVYTPRLNELNASFYRSERAPEFVLFKPDVIDERYPTLENAPVLIWLLRRYRPVLVEEGFLLLRREAGLPVDAGQGESMRALGSGQLTGDTKLVLPTTDGAIWCEMDWEPNTLGRWVGFAFQPPYCELDVFSPGGSTPVKYRIVPAMARAGFLLSPTVGTPADFLRVLAGRAREQQPAAIAIHVNGSFRRLMHGSVRYRLYTLPSFTSATEATEADALLQTGPAVVPP